MLKTGILIPDIHAPYHDVTALNLVLDVMAKEAFDYTVLLGDFVDNYCVSRFSKNPQRLANLKVEYQEATKLLKRLTKVSKIKHMCEGNHEKRLPDFLSKKAPELYDIVLDQDLIGFKKYGWKVTPYYEVLKIGKLNITHDVGKSGITSTRMSMRDAMDNLVIGHNHVFAYHVEANSNCIAHVGASFGWLGDVNVVDYTHKMRARNLWTQGFGTFVHDTKTGCVYVTPHPIVRFEEKLSVCVDGKVYWREV